MDPIQKSSYFHANRITRITLKALEEVLGKNGLNTILNLAHLSHLIDNYPPDNLDRDFDFADFSAIYQALEEMYGPRGGRGLALRTGRSAFADALRYFGAQAGVCDSAFKVLPVQAKLRFGIPAMARVFSQVSDQYTTVQEQENEFIYTIHRCPVCWGRNGADKPVCYVTVGLLQEGLRWASSGREYRVYESRCAAMGQSVCEFTIQKDPLS